MSVIDTNSSEYLRETRDGWIGEAVRMEKERDQAVGIAWKLLKELDRVDFMLGDTEREKVVSEAQNMLLGFPDLILEG